MYQCIIIKNNTHTITIRLHAGISLWPFWEGYSFGWGQSLIHGKLLLCYRVQSFSRPLSKPVDGATLVLGWGTTSKHVKDFQWSSLRSVIWGQSSPVISFWSIQHWQLSFIRFITQAKRSVNAIPYLHGVPMGKALLEYSAFAGQNARLRVLKLLPRRTLRVADQPCRALTSHPHPPYSPDHPA